MWDKTKKFIASPLGIVVVAVAAVIIVPMAINWWNSRKSSGVATTAAS